MGENVWRVWNGGWKVTRRPFGVSITRFHAYFWVPSRCFPKDECKRRTIGIEWPI